MPRLLTPLLLAVLAGPLLAGCDQLGIESASAVAAKREADGKAVGGACRHAGRAIEDCYTLNKKADKAAVYAGWREMNEYMRENKIDPVPPVLKAETAVAAKPAEADEAEPAEAKTADAKGAEQKAAEKTGGKAGKAKKHAS